MQWCLGHDLFWLSWQASLDWLLPVAGLWAQPTSWISPGPICHICHDCTSMHKSTCGASCAGTWMTAQHSTAGICCFEPVRGVHPPNRLGSTLSIGVCLCSVWGLCRGESFPYCLLRIGCAASKRYVCWPLTSLTVTVTVTVFGTAKPCNPQGSRGSWGNYNAGCRRRRFPSSGMFKPEASPAAPGSIWLAATVCMLWVHALYVSVVCACHVWQPRITT